MTPADHEPRPTLRELAAIYVADGGLGWATIRACGWDLKPRKTFDDLAQELAWAEADIRNVGPKAWPPEHHIERHLRRVLRRTT